MLDISHLCRCRRIIPAPQDIVPSLNALVEKKWVDESGVSLLTDATAQAHSAALRIIQSGRLSGELLCNPAAIVPPALPCPALPYMLMRCPLPLRPM